MGNITIDYCSANNPQASLELLTRVSGLADLEGEEKMFIALAAIPPFSPTIQASLCFEESRYRRQFERVFTDDLRDSLLNDHRTGHTGSGTTGTADKLK